jgi:uncharacterized RDD family membrane protein YckC
MSSQWWYSAGGERKGPVDFETLRGLYVKGAIDGRTLAWREDMQGWEAVNDIPDLEPLRLAVPPELPKNSAKVELTSLSNAGPWRRFVARLIDLWLFGLLVALAAGYIGSRLSMRFAFWLQEPGTSYWFGWFLLPAILFVEGLVFAAAGTTPGKALLGLRITRSGGGEVGLVDYLRRQVGCYWYGLGTGFPLVNLVAMARQRGHVISGRGATYDRAMFEVRAPRLGIFRFTAVACSVFALLVVNVVLVQIGNAVGREQGYSVARPSTWTNRVTGKTIRLPEGWRHEEVHNSSGEPAQIFHSPWPGLRVTLLVGDGEHSNLTAYADSWRQGVVAALVFPPGATRVGPNGLEVWESHGYSASNKAQRSVSIAKRDGHNWHVNIVADITMTPAATAEAVSVRESLLSSL